MSDEIHFSQREKEELLPKIQDYCNRNLDTDMGRFDAEFLLDFFAKEMGVYYYNRGILDAQEALRHKFEDLNEILYALEKPTA